MLARLTFAEPSLHLLQECLSSGKEIEVRSYSLAACSKIEISTISWIFNTGNTVRRQRDLNKTLICQWTTTCVKWNAPSFKAARVVSQKAKAKDRTKHKGPPSPGQSTVSVLVTQENCRGTRDLAAREEYQWWTWTILWNKVISPRSVLFHSSAQHSSREKLQPALQKRCW